MTESLRLEGRLTRRDRARSDYLYLPFEVPDGIAGLTVRYDHDVPMRADLRTGGNTIDLGLFGPGSLGFGTPAFRGWSGSERREVRLGVTAATPGYRPGPIDPGTWHVILGLYQISARGCRFRIGIELERAPRSGELPATRPPALPVPARRGYRRRPPAWIPGDLHSHTVHSDGADDVADLARAATAAGLHFLAVTDHNTDAHLPGLPRRGGRSPLLIAGEEITTYRGHAGALGLHRWVDFRHRTADELRRAIEAVHAQGGLVSVNHPFSATSPWEFGDVPPLDAVEVWNGPWGAENERSLGWWDTSLRAGRRITAVGGSDHHGKPRGKRLGTPVTWVRAEAVTAGGILDAIRAGRVFLSRERDGPSIGLAAGTGRARAGIGDELRLRRGEAILVRYRVRAAPGRQVRLVSARGTEAVSSTRGEIHRVERTIRSDGQGYLRLDVVAPDGAIEALGNPIYLREE